MTGVYAGAAEQTGAPADAVWRYREDVWRTRDPGDMGYCRREWRYGAFERGFTLPERVTGEGIIASYHNGVLEVVVPNAAPQTAEPTHIPVTSHETKTLAAGQAPA